MKLKNILIESLTNTNVLCHIAGPSGCGKTTLLEKIKKLYPDILVKDLDEFDDESSEILGLQSTEKKHWKDESFKELAELRQKLLDNLIKENKDKIIVLGGFHTEDKYILNVHTKNKFRLNTSAKESAKRAYLRSQSEDPKYRRTKEELPKDISDAKKAIKELDDEGYIPLSEEEILDFIKEGIKNK